MVGGKCSHKSPLTEAATAKIRKCDVLHLKKSFVYYYPINPTINRTSYRINVYSPNFKAKKERQGFTPNEFQTLHAHGRITRIAAMRRRNIQLSLYTEICYSFQCAFKRHHQCFCEGDVVYLHFSTCHRSSLSSRNIFLNSEHMRLKKRAVWARFVPCCPSACTYRACSYGVPSCGRWVPCAFFQAR